MSQDRGVFGHFFLLRQCSYFATCIRCGLAFARIHPGPRSALSDVDILWDCLHSTEEQRGLGVSTWPVLRCQRVIFTFSVLSDSLNFQSFFLYIDTHKHVHSLFWVRSFQYPKLCGPAFAVCRLPWPRLVVVVAAAVGVCACAWLLLVLSIFLGFLPVWILSLGHWFVP